MNSSINTNKEITKANHYGNIIKKCIVLSLFLLMSIITLTSCAPNIELNQKYAYTDIQLQYGYPVSTNIGDYIDLEALNSKDRKFVEKHAVIEYDGVKESGKNYDRPGDYSLVIKYCGRQYRRYSVTIRDSKPPVFTKKQDLYTFKGLNEDIDYDGMFAATDNASGMKIDVDHSEVKPNTVGNYRVHATATDSSGNVSKADALLHVQAPKYGAMGTYIFIDINKQQLTYFVNGKVEMESPVVTGTESTGHGTPRGVYTVNGRATGARLKGEDWDVKVDYWVSFIGSSIGMHSAQWRGSFGGTQYQYNGSHGCVNMPTDKAAYVFNNVPYGTPVIVQ